MARPGAFGLNGNVKLILDEVYQAALKVAGKWVYANKEPMSSFPRCPYKGLLETAPKIKGSKGEVKFASRETF